MTLDEAREICEQWLRYLDRQRVRAETLQRAAHLARNGRRAEALRIKSKVDLTPMVFDGARLKPAVERLLEETCGNPEE